MRVMRMDNSNNNKTFKYYKLYYEIEAEVNLINCKEFLSFLS